MPPEKKKMKFERTVTMGNIITIFSLVVPLILWQFALKASVDNNTRNVARHDSLLERIVDTQNLALRNQAILQQRFDDHVERMKHIE